MCSTEQNLHSGKSSLTACFVQKSDFQSKEQNALMIRHLYKGIELPLGVQEFTTILYSLPLLVDEHSVPVPSRAVHFLVTAFVIRVQAFHPSHCELLTGSRGHGRLQLTDTQQAPFVSCPPSP